MRFERRCNDPQRAAVERLLAAAQGEARVVSGRDGSVFVYDEVRASGAPATRRTRVTASGETDVPDFLTLS